MGRAVRQFEKEISFRLGTGVTNISHRTVWDAPSASSKKKLGREVGYVTSNCVGRAVRQFEKEVSFTRGTGEEYITSNCMERAVRQFEKGVSFKLGKGEVLSH